MKKTLLFITLFCLSNLLFGQTQKGTHFLGTSHISAYHSSERHFLAKRSTLNKVLFIQYGIFVKDNVLLGANLLYSPDISYAFFNPQSGNSIALNPFYKRYFGQKKIKPFAEAEVGVKLLNGNVFAKAEIRPGVALFLNSNTSIDLSFNFSVLDINRPFKRFFPQGLVPRVDLALHFFLQYDKNNETQIIAKDMIRRGVFLADFSNSAFSKNKSTSILTNIGLKYFLLNNIYVNGGLNISFNRSFFSSRFSNQLDLNPRLGLGAFLPIGNYSALAIHTNGQQRLFSNRESSVNFAEAQAKAGLALFLGRQKIEILSGVEFIKYKSNIAEIPSQSLSNFVFTLNHEYFVSDKLSFSSSFSAFPKNQRQRLNSDAFNRRTIYGERYDLDLKLHLKWYINTKKLKKKSEE